MPKLKNGEVYLFKWRDHSTSDADEYASDCIITSVGIFQREVDHFYVFSRSTIDDITPYHVINIIKQDLLSAKMLKPVK